MKCIAFGFDNGKMSVETHDSLTDKAEKAVDEAHEKGQFIAFLLGLKLVNGRYNTEWGTKTPTGLYNCMVRVVETCAEDLSI
jgi:hypothetical protein